MAASTQPIRTL